MQAVEIRVRGQMDKSWADRFGGLTITHTENGETALTGLVRDQAALHGLLSRLADLGLELISFRTSSSAEGDLRESSIAGGGDPLTEKQ
jgi:hypothetical protein